jgi:hypothetical protein
LFWRSLPVNGLSVPFSLRTLNCSGVRAFLHSSSLRENLTVIPTHPGWIRGLRDDNGSPDRVR